VISQGERCEWRDADAAVIPRSHQGCDRTATVLRPIFWPNRVRSQ